MTIFTVVERSGEKVVIEAESSHADGHLLRLYDGTGRVVASFSSPRSCVPEELANENESRLPVSPCL
ncbi:hypothetical protein [Mesorhizobium muleiense]|uniref:Uncharacterized protein n=1 Tax=Mesorhizobium muleiense TaxID=1004279 RepID=A0A1G8LCC9_9HYPH|nr:hypothetical protein [Mesorhizobium muleiense]MCF6100358.1 hypothetical protein [Mesorhizobium muleiense]SDI53305.1 hypothetical protein SAMN05428953_102204 [Mesorhizobium muleiense]